MSRGLIRAKDIEVDDALDRIFKAWVGHKLDELSLRDGYLLERMEYADQRLREGGKGAVYSTLVNDMLSKFRHQGVGDPDNTDNKGELTRRTIESDIARAKRFFLSARPREDKQYAKGKYIEWGERMLAKFEEQEDSLSWNMLFKELNSLQGFKKDDIELPDMSAIQPPPIMVVLDPTDIGVPAIDNLEEELRILSAPKGSARNNQAIDAEDVEAIDGNE